MCRRAGSHQNPCVSDYGAAHVYACTQSDGCQASGHQSSSTFSTLGNFGDLITNADQGVVLSFQDIEGGQNSEVSHGCFEPCQGSNRQTQVPGTANSYLANISTGGEVSLATTNIPGGPVQPVLQTEDGSFFGTTTVNGASQLIHFDTSGNLLGISGNYQPQIATSDGGLIAATSSGTAVTLDVNLKITGAMGDLPTQSWTGNSYQLGSISQISDLALDYASTFAAARGGNQSANKTAIKEKSLS